MYADDTQLYLSFDLNDDNDKNDSSAKIESCIKDIKLWITVNKLKLNDSKYHQSKSNTNSLQIASSEIVASPSNHNLGILFDNALSMDAHIKNVCKATYFQIRNINEKLGMCLHCCKPCSFFNYISPDNGNALLYGITESQLKKLQQAQNAAARMLTEQENLIIFHLFYSCQFVLEFILKSFFSPGKHFMTWPLLYISELNNLHNPSVNFVLHIKTSSPFLGLSLPMATEPCAPKLWNSLPAYPRFCSSLDIFKKTLKTQLI